MSWARFGENFPSWLAIPRNRLSSRTLLGACLKTCVFLGSAVIPFLSTTCPRNLMLFADFAFVWLEGCSCCASSVEDVGKSGIVLRLVFSENQHIIHLADHSTQSAQNEVFKGTRYSEGQLIKAVSTHRCDEGGE